MAKKFILKRSAFHQQFWNSRAKIQFIGGAFANGKTTLAIVKALTILKDYPGVRVLFGRETERKLKTYTIPDFFEWFPRSWEDSWSKSDGELRLKNGSMVHFRYVQQRGTDAGDSTSNLLSGNYGLVVIDQIEDPGIVEKDFNDLMGRLRQDKPYDGTDPTMPKSGPRWAILTANPTGGWVWHKLIKPVYDYREGIPNENLIADANGVPLIELFEGSTYDNKHNLADDFIKGLEATYRGQMRDRFLLGHWGSFEGLIYPQYQRKVHSVPHGEVLKYFDKYRSRSFSPSFIEAYDHGMRSPSCYLLAFVDGAGNVIVLDGFYKEEQSPKVSAGLIHAIRRIYGVPDDNPIYADPAIFRRSQGTSNVVGQPVTALFMENGIYSMRRGQNDIIGGITKVASYLDMQRSNRNPFTGVAPAPLLYFSDKLTFIDKEIGSYHWKRQASTGEIVDMPSDKNDHAMDTIKYLLTSSPAPSVLPGAMIEPPEMWQWHTAAEKRDDRVRQNANRMNRYGWSGY